jgi:hypothetical protein
MDKYTVTIVDNKTKEIHTASGDEILLNLATVDDKGLLRSNQLQTIGHYEHLSRMHLLLGVNIYDNFFRENKLIEKGEL